MRNGHRQRLRTMAMLAGMVIGLTFLLAACGGGVDEAASGTVIGKIEASELGPGDSASVTFDLSPGKYVLICNVGDHYKSGMYTALVVDGEGESDSSTVSVQLGEWFTRSDSASVAAGSITFQARNSGEDSHNLVIIKTDLAPGALVLS